MGVDVEYILMTLAERFISDVRATTPLRPTCSVKDRYGEIPVWAAKSNVFLRRDDPDAVEAMLWVDRSGTGATFRRAQFDEGRFDEILAYLADEWSEAVTEALVKAVGVEVARRWPKCTVHDHSMDPIADAGRAWWVCRDDKSLRVPIGELDIESP